MRRKFNFDLPGWHDSQGYTSPFDWNVTDSRRRTSVQRRHLIFWNWRIEKKKV